MWHTTRWPGWVVKARDYPYLGRECGGGQDGGGTELVGLELALEAT